MELRKRFLNEAKRVLEPDGKLILTVWNLWPNQKAKRLIIKNSLLKTIGLLKMDYKDIFYPFKDRDGKVLVDRYIHCFRQNELKKLICDIDFQVQKIGINERGKKVKNENIYIIAAKNK